MKLLVFNPNTSPAVTARIAAAVERVRHADVEVIVRQAPHGPEVLESALDESRSVPYVVDAVTEANAHGFSAVIIAAFCDPGLDAAREVSEIPVFGLEETTCAIAMTLGHRFGILTEQPHKVAVKQHRMRRHGFEQRCASVRAIGMGVQAIAVDPDRVLTRGLAIARQMVEEDGAEVIVLGCASMAGHARLIEQELHVPVLDPLMTTLCVAEGLARIGVRHSKRGLYMTPVPQRIQ
jgi:allantoin racemase